MSSTLSEKNTTTTGESNLPILLRNMKPLLNTGSYVFCAIRPEKLSTIDQSKIIGFFRESPPSSTVSSLSSSSSEEEITLIISKEYADKFGLKYSSVITSWITLKVHSSLEAVGLTAAFATALTKANISCNTIAGYYHDHIFVSVECAEKAMKVLEELSSSSST